MRKPPKGNALITGASRGIGYELARVFAEKGHGLVLAARSEAELRERAEELRGRYDVSVKVLIKDLTGPGACGEIYEELQKTSTPIEILVNNAGFGVQGFFSQTELERELQMIQLNIASLTHLTKLFVKKMTERGRGRILNVGSMAGFQPGGPLMAVYYATKAYVLSFSNALAEELRGSGVTVTCLCPGLTDTGFFEAMGCPEKAMKNSPFLMDPGQVARAGYRGLMSGRRIVIPGAVNRLMASVTRWAPRSWVTRAIRLYLERDERQKKS